MEKFIFKNSAKLKKSKISSGLFKIFMENILQVYQDKLRQIEIRDADKEKVEEILALNGLEDLNENHRKIGATLHLFGKFKDPNCNKSKTQQPFSDNPAEVRAFRLKNSYMNKVIQNYLLKEHPNLLEEFAEIKIGE